MTQFKIKITGSGTNTEIADALEQVAKEVRAGDHEKSVAEKGECEWEDATLMTEISETDESAE